MKRLVILLFFSLPLFAQAPKPKKISPPNPQEAIDKQRFKSHTFPGWGGLYDIRIPRTCDHPRMMKGKRTCGVFVAFNGHVPQGKAEWDIRFRVWDETSGSGSKDDIYRVYLGRQTWKGIRVWGVTGHKIMLEATYR